MSVNLHLDSSGLRVLCSTKILPPNLGLPTSPPEKVLPIKKNKRNFLLGIQEGEETARRGNKQSNHGSFVVSREHVVAKPGLEEIPGRQCAEKSRGSDGFLDKRTVVSPEGNGVLDKMHARCSTKWLSYGGCIPAILQALDNIEDVGEALSPWEGRLSNKERTIILKEQSRWERALKIFKWFKSKGSYEMNVIHYNIMLRKLGKACKWGYVQGLWDEMIGKGIEPINSTYGTLIDVYSKGGLKAHALCWLGKMSKVGMPPDEVTMGIVVQMYKKARDFQKAEEFFKKWSHGKALNCDRATLSVKYNVEPHVCLSSYTYNTMIDTYGKAGRVKEASETFVRMLEEGIVLTTVTFNTMIHIYGNHGRLEEVTSLMKMMEEIQCLPDTRTYNILISLHTKSNDIKSAVECFKKMKEAGLKPDLVSYRTLLYAFSVRHMVTEAEEIIAEMDDKSLEIDGYTQSALTRMYIEAGVLEKSWSWFQRFHFAGNMSSEDYSANIDAYGERGYLLEAERAFICCQEAKKQTVVEFNVMIKAYGVSKSYEKACELFESMEGHGVTPDKCTYNSLIQILASNDVPHKAKPYLEKMRETGYATDCIPYCAVISSFVKLGQLDMAEEAYREMVEFHIKPDAVVYGVLINGFAETGNIKAARSYVEAMKKEGISINSVIYNSLIKLYTKVGYLKEAEETYKKLQSSDVYSSNCMINLYCERSMVRQAEAIFRTMKQKGQANEFTFAMMLCMYKRNGRFEEATQIAKEMRERKVLTDVLSYNNVLSLYALDGRFKEAVETFIEMVSTGAQPDHSTFKSLGLILIKLGVSKKAVGKIEAMRNADGRRGLDVWISTLSSVVNVENCNNDDEEENNNISFF